MQAGEGRKPLSGPGTVEAERDVALSLPAAAAENLLSCPCPVGVTARCRPNLPVDGGQTSRLRRLLCRVLGSDTRGMLEAPRVLAPAPGFITEAGL